MKDFIDSIIEERVVYELIFDDGANNGFGFPCDAGGHVDNNMHESAKENLTYCLSHPDEFSRYNEVVRLVRRTRIPARGRCVCGQEMELYDQYRGACQCPNCKRWYNLFGQELIDPAYWEDSDC